MELGIIYQDIKKKLAESGIEAPDLEAKRLIQAVMGLDSVNFITNKEKPLSKPDIDQINHYLARRLNGEPLSKILGVKEFWGLEFEVTKDTLDPRPDTETLIEAVLGWVGARKDETLKIIDLGTGTGCILITLLSELSNAQAIGVDISEDALAVAAKNAEKHKMSNRIKFVQGDWLVGFEDESFDLIVSNPPYIPNPDIENLSKEVKNHDPILALDGGKNGLNCYKIIFSQLKNKLNGQNRAFLEIGFGQLSNIARLVDDSNLLLCDSKADISGIPRVVEISCGDK